MTAGDLFCQVYPVFRDVTLDSVGGDTGRMDDRNIRERPYYPSYD